MTRSDDVKGWNAERAKVGVSRIQDMTPTPLTAPGFGPWIPCTGKVGNVHLELSDTTTPEATVIVQTSNTKKEGSAVTVFMTTLTGSGAGDSFVPLTGAAWIRVGVPFISGVNAAVSSTLAYL